MASSILRLPDVMARTGLPRSTVYLRISQGTFPKPIHLGFRTVGWIAAEIDAWIDGQILQSRGPQAALREMSGSATRNSSR